LVNPLSPLRLNVGFIVHQFVGYNRDFSIEIEKIHLPPDLNLADLSGTARVGRTPQGLLVQVKMAATVLLQCGRCLVDFQQSLGIKFAELYAFTQRSVTDSDLILPEDGHIDLTPLVREYMLLDVPISPLCSPSCKGLCLVCGENLNESNCHHDPDGGDPRLTVLKPLLDSE
jgi:uncharacterized protein